MRVICARCRRQLRHQDPHLSATRWRPSRAGDAARAAGEVRRRPARDRSSPTSMRATTAVKARMAVDAIGRHPRRRRSTTCTASGPIPVYPRSSAVEAQPGAQPRAAGRTDSAHYRGRTRVVFQNKAPYGQYRAVGPPDRVHGDRRPRRPGGARDRAWTPRSSAAATTSAATPIRYQRRPGRCSRNSRTRGCSTQLLKLMDYDALRAEQAEARKRGVHRGIGLASFIEITNPSAGDLRHRRRVASPRRTAAPCS